MKKIIISTTLALLISIVVFPQNNLKNFPILNGPYLGQKEPGLIPERFAPELFSTKGKFEFKLHSSLTFSPDGKEIYFVNQSFPVVPGYSKTLMYMKFKNGSWSEPEIAPFSGKYGDGLSVFSENGSRLYFNSQRPLNGEEKPKDTDIWYVDKLIDSWSEPKNLGSPINSQFNEWGFTLAKNGNIYFGRDSENQDAGYDIYLSVCKDGKYFQPKKLSSQINSEFSEGSPCIAPDESFLIFYRSNRSNSGLYISFKRDNGLWTEGMKISDTWNLPRGIPFCTTITPDGKYIFILNRMDGIYWVDSKVIEEFKPKKIK